MYWKHKNNFEYSLFCKLENTLKFQVDFKLRIVNYVYVVNFNYVYIVNYIVNY